MNESALPELPGGWVRTRLGAIAIIASGQTPKEISDLGKEGEIPFYKVSDMNKIGNNKFMIDSEIHLTKNNVEKFRIHVQNKGTVIFPKRGGAIATNKKRIHWSSVKKNL